MARPHGLFCLPTLLGSFGRTGVGAGGLETFWDELLGKKYYMSEKSFFYQIWGVVNFGFRRSEAPKRPILEPTPMRPHSGPFLGPFAGGKILVRREKKLAHFWARREPVCAICPFFYEKIFFAPACFLAV